MKTTIQYNSPEYRTDKPLNKPKKDKSTLNQNKLPPSQPSQRPARARQMYIHAEPPRSDSSRVYSEPALMCPLNRTPTPLTKICTGVIYY